MIRRLAAALLCTLLVSVTAAGRDVPGSKDSPLLKRYEGSTIVKYSTSAFDAYALPTGPAKGAWEKAELSRSANVEGRVTRITYAIPEGRSVLEVLRNYESELKGAGYTILFKGIGAELGTKVDKLAFARAARYDAIELTTVARLGKMNQSGEKDDGFLAARLSRPEGDVHVAVYLVPVSQLALTIFGLLKSYTPGQVLAQVDLIEAKPIETRMVTVSASEMEKAIQERGSIALYGIYFDTNSADVKPESTPALQEIAKLMKSQPKLRLLVVGHTDTVGTFESNMDLSTRRARAVVQALTTGHGVDAKRLTPVGVSFASPVASNRNDDGRAKNRRVQLVEF